MKEQKDRISLLGAGYSTDNLGVAALTSGALATIWKAYPNVEVQILDYNKHPETYELEYKNKNKVVELINIRFTKKIWLKNNVIRLVMTSLMIRIVPIKSIREKLYLSHKLLKKIYASTLVMAIMTFWC